MFKTFKSSAGSGKTTHLVAEYLTICFRYSLNRPSATKYRNILAITFTNNATAEMKERILKTLHHFAFTPDYNTLSPSFAAILKMIRNNLQPALPCEDDFIRKRSKTLLHDILYDYTFFSISTIDSFFQRMIRAFAVDMDLNVNFNLEINQDELFAQTIDILLSKVNEEEAAKPYSISGHILDMMMNGLEEKGKDNIEKELNKILHFIGNEEAHDPILQLQMLSSEEIKQKCKQLIEKKKKLKSQLVAVAGKGNDLIKRNGCTEDDFKGRSKGAYRWYSKMIDCPAEIPTLITMEKAIASGSLLKDETAMSEWDHQLLVDYYHQIRELHTEFSTVNILTRNINSFLLIFDLQQIMEEIKQLDNLFLLSDANGKVHDSIKDEDAPYIYEKIGNRYSYFLIDEFQDTSKMQWENLLPLVKNALSGISNTGEQGSAVLFGDVKQAIYRFRNGDSSLFNALSDREGFKKMMNKSVLQENDFDNVVLDTNFRSSKAIITFNNRFFEFLKNREKEGEKVFVLAEEYYQDVQQKSPDHSVKSGFVRIRFQQKESSEKFMEEEIVSAVEDAINKGFEYQDIAILTTGKESGNRYGRYLSERAIPVISSNSILLKSSKEVNLLIATLQYIINRQNKIAKLIIIRYLIEREKFLKIEEAVPHLSDEKSFRDLLERFGVNFSMQKMRMLPIFSLLKELILIYKLNSADPFILNLLDNVLEFTSKNSAEITSFLDWWERKRDTLSIISSNGINGITITTVHKSKGLQYPVVIFPSRKFSSQQTKQKFWYDYADKEMTIPSIPVNFNKELKGTIFEERYREEINKKNLDNLNAIYVAHTRASEGFYIITGKKGGGSYSSFLSDFVNENNVDIKEDKDDDHLYWLGDMAYAHLAKPNPTTDDHKLTDFSFSSFLPDAIPRMPLMTKEQQQGIAVHEFLSSLTLFPKTEEEIMMLKMPEDNIVAAHIHRLLSQIVKDEEIKPFFSGKEKTLNEVSIVDSEGDIYRPDRIAILGDEVLVVDYKTGKPNPSYKRQIEKYIELLKQMGYQKVTGKILFSEN